jgi:hypothetical protein
LFRWAFFNSLIEGRDMERPRVFIIDDEKGVGEMCADYLKPAYRVKTFRFNRRMSESRGLLFRRVLEAAATQLPPIYKELVAKPPQPNPLGSEEPSATPATLGCWEFRERIRRKTLDRINP